MGSQPQVLHDPGPDGSRLRVSMDEINSSMDFHPATAISMSCGTVTIDLARGKVLVIWNSRLKIWQLPKGRRNISESMLEAALRETYEETGYRATPLTLKIPTRASAPTPAGVKKMAKDPDITEGYPSTEFIGACIYPDPQSRTPSLKMVYWYVATADSTTTPDADTQEFWEKLSAKWIPLADAPSTLRFRAEAEAVAQAVEIVKRSGHTIGHE